MGILTGTKTPHVEAREKNIFYIFCAHLSIPGFNYCYYYISFNDDTTTTMETFGEKKDTTSFSRVKVLNLLHWAANEARS